MDCWEVTPSSAFCVLRSGCSANLDEDRFFLFSVNKHIEYLNWASSNHSGETLHCVALIVGSLTNSNSSGGGLNVSDKLINFAKHPTELLKENTKDDHQIN